MKSFYSIINITPNPAARESIAVGLILLGPERFYVRFSARKKRIIKPFLEDNIAILEYLEKQISTKIREENNRIQNNLNDNQLFDYNSFLKYEYFEYLHAYSNNLLQFSKPTPVSSPVSDELFNKLFTLLVSKDLEEMSALKENSELRNRIERKLIKRVAPKVHTHVQFSSRVLSSLYFNFEMECIGLNGVFTGAKAIDFEKSAQTIDLLVSHYFALSELLERKYQRNKSKNNFYIIGDEPEKSRSKEHTIWTQLRQQDKFKVISSDDAGLVAEKIEATEAKRFLEV